MKKNATNLKKGLLELHGARCASCVYAIEHLGRKAEGVKSIRVDANAQEIDVEYEGNPGSLEKIVEIVRHLGYNASVRRDSIS